MAKKIQIDIEVNGKMQKATVSSKKLKDALAGVDDAAKKTAKSTGQLDRNIKGTADISANATKNFSKMSQGMGGLVGVYATIAAQVFAITAAFQLFKNATDFRNLIAGQEALGASSGIAYKTITQGIQNATDAQLGYAEAARAAAIGTSAGLSPSQLTELGRAAKNASVALGRDLGDSFDRLVRGVVKAEPEVLDELGIILRLAPATEKYAQSIGKAANELTAFERSQAVANEVLGQAEEKFGLIEAQLDPTVASLNQFLKAFDDVKKSIFEAIAGPISTFAKFLSENILALVGVLGLFGLSVVKTILPNLHQWRKDSMEVVDTNKAKLAELRAELDKTKVKYLEMNASAANLAAGNQVLGKNASAKTGAFGFLAGNTTSKSSSNAAIKAFKHYNNQTEQLQKGSIAKRTGILKKFTAEQVKQLQILHAQRVAYNKAGLIDFNQTVEAKKLKSQELAIQQELIGASAEGMFAKMSAGATRLLGALGWVSLILSLGSILVGIGKSVYESLNGVDERQKAVNETVNQGIEKYKTLNSELERTNAFLDSTSVTGMTEVVARAGQVQSLDVKALIKDINSLDDKRVKASDGFDDFKSKLLETAKNAAELDEGFLSLVTAIESGTDLTEDQIAALEKVAREAGNVKTAFEQASDVINATNAAIQGLVSTSNKPFGQEALVSISAGLKNIDTRTAALQATQADGPQITKAGVEELKRGEAELKAMRDKMSRQGRSGTFSKDTGQLLRLEGGRGGRNANVEALEAYNNKLAELKEREQELQDAASQAHQKTEDELKAIGEEREYIVAVETALKTAIGENRKEQERSNGALLEAERLRTNGLTLQDKLDNIDAAAATRAEANVKKKAQLNVQTSIQNAILAKVNNNEEKLTEEQKIQLQAARDSIAQLGHEIDMTEERNKRAKEMDPILKERLRLQDAIAVAALDAQVVQFQQKLNTELNREFELRKKIQSIKDKEDNAVIKEQAEELSLANPFFDKQRYVAEQTYQLELGSYKRKSDQIEAEYQNTLKSVKLEYDLLEAQKEAQAAKLDALAYEAELAERTDLAKGFRELAADFRAIDYTDARKAANDLALATRDASQKGLDRLVRGAKRTVIELQPVSKVLNDAAKSFSDALTDSFTAIFDSLTDKTMDLKDALKSIGRSFVQSLQKSLIENMIVGPMTQKIGQFFAKFKLKERAAGLLGLNKGTEEGTPGVGGVTNIGGGLDGKGLGTTVPLLVRLDTASATSLPAGAAQAAADGEPATVPGGVGGPTTPTEVVKEQTEATKQNTMATTQAGLQTATMALGAIATVAALTGNEKAAKKLAIVMALLQVAVVALEVAMYVNSLTGRRGGVFNGSNKNLAGYSTGGIAKGSHAGYPAILHGTEAVVPLPNGKSIPVEMSGSGAGMNQNNVSVNVVVNRDGTADTNSEEDSREAGKLGKSIARAVQTEIQNQKRAGGMLSPYGAL